MTDRYEKIRLSDYEALQAECEKLREFVERAKTLLEDPIAVFVNMKAGVIAKPSLRDLIDLHGDVPNGEDVQLLEIARLRSECEKLRKDAERYRWLRDRGFTHADVSLGTDCDGDNFVSYRITFNLPEPAHNKFEDDEWSATDIDAAIDAAMREEGRQ